MRLTMREKKTITKAFTEKYKKSRKKHKGVILNEFIELTGYNRSYASYILRVYGKKVRVSHDKVIVAGAAKKTKRKRKKRYDDGERKLSEIPARVEKIEKILNLNLFPKILRS